MSTKNPTNQKINKELSYTQKCMILANIFTDKKKILINLYDNMPLVKLYTANLNQDNFVYSKIRGALCFIVEEIDKKDQYFLQIYDKKNNSLAFNLPVNKLMIENLTRIEGNDTFFCLITKFEYFGFKFNSKDSMEKFLNIFKVQDNKKFETSLKARDYKCTYKEILKTIKSMKSDFEKKFKAIDSISGKAEKEKDKNLFQKLDELYYLINCVEYDEINKKFNIFIDRTINPRIIQSYIDIYKKSDKKKDLSLRIIFNDYTHILNKKVYVELLINNCMNNFDEAKRLIIFKREHKKRHDKEDFEESKRINSEYYVSKSDPANDKIRNSAIIPKPNTAFQRKDNIAGALKKRNSCFTSIPESTDEDIDHLKEFKSNKN
jgi:hypothetical protein